MESTDAPGVTEASARYLVAAFQLCAESGRRASTGDVAGMLSVEPSSATEMLGKLDDAGYVERALNRGVELTPRGVELARALSRRRCLVESFFDDLGVAIGAERAHAIGCRLPATAVDRLAETSDLTCRDRCRAGEATFDECAKLADVEVA